MISHSKLGRALCLLALAAPGFSQGPGGPDKDGVRVVENWVRHYVMKA